ncbi:MAG: DUF2807 domain-containing protein [Dehalococcoidales bacterium]|nr:DUF2807 domain-containing protein [Dehalococcoidales bacterium]
MDNRNDFDTSEFVKKFVEDISSELKDIKSTITSELREEIENIRKELRNEMDTLKESLKSNVDDVRTGTRPESDEMEDEDGFPFEPPDMDDILDNMPSPSSFFPHMSPVMHTFGHHRHSRHFSMKGEGIAKEFKFSDFDSIHIGGTFRSNITRGDTCKVEINAKESLFRNIDVSKNGQILKITHSKHLGWKAGLSRPEITITLPELKELRLFGATTTTISGFESSEFNLDMSGASELVGNITAEKADIDVSGASFTKLTGSAKSAIIRASGANNLELRDFPIENAAIKLSGASNLAANVTGKLDARLSGTANFSWKGNPIMGDIRTSGLARMARE